MLTFPAPVALVGDALEGELHAAGLTDAQVTLVGDRVRVTGVPESTQTEVAAIVANHNATPVPVADPVADLVAAVNAATNVAGVKSGLVTHLPRAFGRKDP